MRIGIGLALERLEARDVPAADFQTLPVIPGNDPAAVDHVRGIASLGEALGRRPDVFLKIGDSNTEFEPYVENGYLRPLGQPGFNPVASGLAALGQNLVDTWAYFSRPIDGGSNSFSRNDATAYPGFQVPSVFPSLDRELAATRAGVALIMLGTNDLTVGTPAQAFRANLQTLVSRLETAGVVPILSTIPEDLYLGGTLIGANRSFNQAIADLAEQNRLPLWNLFRQESTLPNSGLGPMGLHLSASPSGGGRFSASDLAYGQNVHNLGALQMLDWYRANVLGPPTPVAPLPTWTSLAGHAIYAVGLDAGQSPSVSVYDSSTQQLLDRFTAFDGSFDGGVRLAVGDVNGDGIPDIIVGAGFGGGPVVKAFSGADGACLASFFAYEPSFRGGVSSVAARDLDGDGKAEIAVGAGIGGGPVFAVFHGGDFNEVERNFAFDPSFRGGVNITLGNFAGIGTTIVAGAGFGGGPQVLLFPYLATAPTLSFFALESTFRGGLVVAAGDMDGDGADELAVGTATGSTRVRVIDPITDAELVSFFAGPGPSVAGVRLGFALAGAANQLLVGNGGGDPVNLAAYQTPDFSPTNLTPSDPARAYGIFVA